MNYRYSVKIILNLDFCDENIQQILKTGHDHQLQYLDWDMLVFHDNLKLLTVKEAFKILMRHKKGDLETFFCIRLNNSIFNISCYNYQSKIELFFYFDSDKLLLKEYRPDKLEEVDIKVYCEFLLGWLKQFNIEQLHVEFSKP